ncbi:hypothetical protein J6590_019568 [Homalodisca vitripennis]|nr:hypothetical protein J6590_019568 [Homalodisca vitripennis]
MVGVYRPPKGNIETSLDILSDTLELSPTWKAQTVIMGDVNIDGLTEKRTTAKLDDMLARHNITKLDLPPTRVTHNTTSSSDFVCSNINGEDVSQTTEPNSAPSTYKPRNQSVLAQLTEDSILKT